MARHHFVVALAAILAMAAPTISQQYTQQCPVNEVFSDCGNNGCQNTCANPDIAATCNNGCIPGCICQPGYFRNTKGKCVPPVECDTCKANQVFDDCRNTICQNTCSWPDLQKTCKPERCIAGCICKDGFLRNDLRECVKPADCNKKTCKNQNEMFDPCGERCPMTCAIWAIRSTISLSQCGIPCIPGGGCVCKPGFIRDWGGRCIRPEQCPTCKGANEFYDCGSPCDTTCATLGKQCPIVNVKCTEMCYCKGGFARNSKGVCIPIENCPCKDPNAEIVECVNPCEGGTCAQPLFSPCKRPCLPRGCQCKKNFVKKSDTDPTCVAISKCKIYRKK